MPYTFADFKTDLRAIAFPDGEATNLVAFHDKSIIAAMVDLQTWVLCLQQDNTTLVPHCATFYNCGLTMLPAPAGRIMRVSVIDKINPDTGQEDPDAEDDWCSEITYNPVDFCTVDAYMKRSRACGSCLPAAYFFGLSAMSCMKAAYPVPTDEGLPAGLPLLPLGFHYPQESTNAGGRALSGVWAMERGKIYLAPWIQSTETVVIKWDGIKTKWADADLMDENPNILRAVKAWVMKDHAAYMDKDYAAAKVASDEYDIVRADLIHECREQTRQRECEPSHARAASSAVTLYYNDEQKYTANCADDETGDPVTVTIPAETIASTISKADANIKARDEAKRQAEARLDCEETPTTYWNEAQTVTESCTGSSDHPLPDGQPVTVTIEAGRVSSTVSQEAANAAARELARDQARSQLSCTYWNKAQSATANCPAGSSGDAVTKTVAARTYSSQISEADADQQAINAAYDQAAAELECDGGPPTLYTNDERRLRKSGYCDIIAPAPGVNPFTTVTVIVPAGRFTDISKAAANARADAYGQSQANYYWLYYCQAHQYGEHEVTV